MAQDYTVGDTIYFKFTTRAFATGIPTVLAGSPVLSAYEDASITQITAGVSLTVDLDSVVGLNLATIVATGANGFETGKHYGIVITTGTVGGVSVVGEVIGQFTLEKSAAAVDLANATDGLSALKTLIDTVNTDLGNATDGLGALKTLIDAVKAETVLIVADTGELQTDWVNGGRLDLILDIIAADVLNLDGAAMRGTDNAALASVLGALADAAAAGDPTSADTVMQYMKQLINTLEGAVGIPVFPAAADPANNVSLAESIRAIRDDVTAIAGAAMRGTDSAALASVATEARLAELDAANIPADLDAVLVDTNEVQGKLPTNKIMGSGVLTDKDDEIDAIKTATDKLTFTVANVVDANILRIDGVAAAATRLQEALSVEFSGQVSGATTTTTLIDSGLTQADTDHWKGRIIIFLDGGLKFQATDITLFDPATDKLTFTAVTTAPTAGPGGTKYIIV